MYDGSARSAQRRGVRRREGTERDACERHNAPASFAALCEPKARHVSTTTLTWRSIYRSAPFPVTARAAAQTLSALPRSLRAFRLLSAQPTTRSLLAHRAGMRALPSPLRFAPPSRSLASQSRRCPRGVRCALSSDPSRKTAAPPAASPWAQGVAEYRRRHSAQPAPKPPAAEDPADAVLLAFGVANKSTRLALQRRRGVFLHADLLARRLAHLQARPLCAAIHPQMRRD